MSLLTSRTDDLSYITSLSDTPLYNIKAVVQKTQIQTSTLRAWERRYGIPKPERSDHGHRRYSARDLALLIWLRERVEEGMAISHAVAMVQQAVEPPPPLRPLTLVPIATLAPPSSAPNGFGAATMLPAIGQRLVRAITRFDAQQAHALVNHVCACYSVEAVVLDLFCPMLMTLGERWAEGSLTIAEEHFGSNFIRQRLLGMVQLFTPLSLGRRVVCACPSSEAHELGLLMLAVLVQQRGWEICYLGQHTSLDGLTACLTKLQPDVVCASISLCENLPELVEMGHLVEALPLTHRPIFTYGGGAFLAALQEQNNLPGVYIGASLSQAVETMTRLVTPAGVQSAA